MAGRIPGSFINNLLAITNIVDLVDIKVPLKKQGKNYHACCPFHNEKTPSFTVNKKRQFYYCFGCGAHGNAIDFLMNYDTLNFIEAIEELSSFYNLDIPYEHKKSKTQIQLYQRQNLYQLMNKINCYYHTSLSHPSANNAKEYLRQRQLTTDIIEHFSIGFAPAGWDNLLKKFSINIDIYKQLNNAGMLVSNKAGLVYDRFRERIMFPIRDRRGRVIGFGGRALGNVLPKYLNSPDTDIFHKGHQLFGLYEATKNNNKLAKLLVVEGYTDVIALTQYGIPYTVASLGTSTTSQHIQLLYRSTDTIIYCYDGDLAGKQAAWRALKTTLPYLTDGRQVRFIFLPDGEDPDTLVRKEGKDIFEKRINNAQTLSKFFFDSLVSQVDLKIQEGRAKFSKLTIPLIKQIPSETLRLSMAQKLGNFIGIPDLAHVLAMMNRETIKLETYQAPKLKPTTMRILISLLVQNPNFSKLVPSLEGISHIQIPGLSLFQKLVMVCKSTSNITTGHLLELYRDHKFTNQLEKLAIWNDIEIEEIAENTFKDALHHLFNSALDKRFDYLMAKERSEGLTLEERNEVRMITLSYMKNNYITHTESCMHG
ncbi:DNA primase [Candidatus Hartigia pinicola]|nr:DNA primase [Candidatus Hartigia pinicola]